MKGIRFHVPKRDSVFPLEFEKLDIVTADKSYYFDDQVEFTKKILNRAHTIWGKEQLTFVVPSLAKFALERANF